MNLPQKADRQAAPHAPSMLIPTQNSSLTSKRAELGAALIAVLMGTASLTTGCGEPFTSAPDTTVDGGVPDGGESGAGGGQAGNGGGDAGLGGEGGTGGGCADIPVILDNMSQYEYKVWRGGCDDNHTIASSVEASSQHFESEGAQLCIRPGDVMVVQVKDNTDFNSLEFTTGTAPVSVEASTVANGNPMNNGLFNILCGAGSGYTSYNVVTDDKNALPNGYKYEGNLEQGNLPPSNAFRTTY